MREKVLKFIGGYVWYLYKTKKLPKGLNNCWWNPNNESDVVAYLPPVVMKVILLSYYRRLTFNRGIAQI
jgi:hypothetical protein